MAEIDLLHFEFPIDGIPWSRLRSTQWRRFNGGVAFHGTTVGAFDGAEAFGDAGFAGGDGFAVAAAPGAFGEGLAVAFDFADVGFAFTGVGGDGEQDGAGGGLVQDEADRAAIGVGQGQGDELRWAGCGFGLGTAFQSALMQLGEHEVSTVDAVTGGAEVTADPADVAAAAVAIPEQLGCLRLGGLVRGQAAQAELAFELVADAAGVDEPGQVAGEVRFLGLGGKPDGQAAGGDVIDEAIAAVRGGEAVGDEPFVLRQVGQEAAAWLLPGALRAAG